MPSPLSIATVTLARDADEEDLLRRSIHALARTGVPVFVSDGGSGDRFLEFLATEGIPVAPPVGRGLVAQVVAALTAAADDGAEFVLYTESDKLEFFERHLHLLLAQEAGSDPPPLTIAGREPDAYATFPAVQRRTEATINDLCSESFGTVGDYSYGPFVMHRSLLPWLSRIPGDLGWGWRHFIFAVAHRLGHRLAHLTGDFRCPEEQRNEDQQERGHRLRQLEQNLRGLELGLSVPLD